jgi:hypothetical protein
MKRLALSLACFASACASTYAANPNDPVDMAAELGDRGRQYVAMGEICDVAAEGAYKQTIVETLQTEQARLGALSGLMNRAYRGTASRELVVHMQAQMSEHGLSASEFCAEVVHQAQTESNLRATQILAMTGEIDVMAYARMLDRPPYADTPSFDVLDGYLAWPE